MLLVFFTIYLMGIGSYIWIFLAVVKGISYVLIFQDEEYCSEFCVQSSNARPPSEGIATGIPASSVVVTAEVVSTDPAVKKEGV